MNTPDLITAGHSEEENGDYPEGMKSKAKKYTIPQVYKSINCWLIIFIQVSHARKCLII